MAEQLWKGRFSKAVDSRVNDFNSSIRFDQRMIAQDMRGSGVHATMLAKQGIISEQDCEDILNGLASIADDLASGKLEIDPNAEDVHTFVEQTLTARIGDAGKRLHTGRSRNDQVALDIRLTLRDYSRMLQGRIVELVRVICKKAAENTAAVMPGYTHLQRAQPITFGHALMAYTWMLLRDLQRFEDATARMDAQCPLGSGALAGTTYPLDRAFTAEKLGFAAPCANSLDGVSDRDFCIELAAAISTCMMHLSRLSEEIILWCSWEFKFIELDDAFTTGSSIMPQKKNPDVTEHKHTDEGSCGRNKERNRDGDNDREHNAFGFADRAKLFHYDGAFLAGCQQFHERRLNNGNECHVRISRNGNRPELIRSKTGCYKNCSRTVRTADDADGGRKVIIKTENQPCAEVSDKYAELSCRTEEQTLGICDQRTEIRHCTDAEEDERRVNAELDSEIEIVD